VLASDLIALYRPKHCGIRVYLRERGQAEEEASPYEKVLRTLGIRHEKEHLATLGAYVEVSELLDADPVAKTVELIGRRTPVVYQPRFEATALIGGAEVTVIGQPDFLILGGSEYIIRDSKISRRIDDKNHPEIILQLQLYGWLFEQGLGHPPQGLEAHSGRGDIVPIPFDGGTAALEELGEIVRLKLLKEEPYEPVGWTKCTGCSFSDRCWRMAGERRDVALVPDVDQGLATLEQRRRRTQRR
jgi:predicted RecB family nuclease